MKCPKCGYVSFDYLDSCRQCSTNLTETRKKLGLELLPSSVPETLLGLAVAESASLSEDSDFTFQEPDAEQKEDLVFSDSDLFAESDLDFSTEQLELGLGDTPSPLEDGQSGAGDLGPIDFDFPESDEAEPFLAEPAALEPAPLPAPEPAQQPGLSDMDFDEFELSDTDPAVLSDMPEAALPESTLPSPGEDAEFSLDMDDFLKESTEIEENDLEMTSIDEEDLSFDDLDEFELLDENDLAGTTTDARQPPKQNKAHVENPKEWKLEDALDLSDDELLDAIPDLKTED